MPNNNNPEFGAGSVATPPAILPDLPSSELSQDDLDMARLSDHAYRDQSDETIPDGFEIIGISELTKNGYAGTAYRNKKTGEIIIGHRGTEFDMDYARKDDLLADLNIVIGNTPKQVKDALTFLNKIAKENNIDPKSIHNTGHSLGGFVSEEVALKLGSKSTSFDSPQSRFGDLLLRKELLKKNGGNIKVIVSSPNVVNSGIKLLDPLGGRIVDPIKLPGSITIIDSHDIQVIIAKMLEKGIRKHVGISATHDPNILISPSENIKSAAKSLNNICSGI